LENRQKGERDGWKMVSGKRKKKKNRGGSGEVSLGMESMQGANLDFRDRLKFE
jgi:hypothetical protein